MKLNDNNRLDTFTALKRFNLIIGRRTTGARA
jgi:hypothetical protein